MIQLTFSTDILYYLTIIELSVVQTKIKLNEQSVQIINVSVTSSNNELFTFHANPIYSECRESKINVHVPYI